MKHSNPNSLQARDVRSHLHPFTNLAQLEESGPLVFNRGEGIYVYDDDGKRYIEGLSGLWCASLGFGEKRLVAAATRQMEKLPFYHNFAGKAREAAVDGAGADVEGVLRQLLLGSQRLRRQARLVLQQRARPVG